MKIIDKTKRSKKRTNRGTKKKSSVQVDNKKTKLFGKMKGTIKILGDITNSDF